MLKYSIDKFSIPEFDSSFTQIWKRGLDLQRILNSPLTSQITGAIACGTFTLLASWQLVAASVHPTWPLVKVLAILWSSFFILATLLTCLAYSLRQTRARPLFATFSMLANYLLLAFSLLPTVLKNDSVFLWIFFGLQLGWSVLFASLYPTVFRQKRRPLSNWLWLPILIINFFLGIYFSAPLLVVANLCGGLLIFLKDEVRNWRLFLLISTYLLLLWGTWPS